MDLLAKLTEDMKSAMKAGEKDRLLVIRTLINEVKTIDLQPTKPTPEGAVEAYGKKVKKSIEEYEKLNKPEQVAELKREYAVVEQYLPKKASAGDTEKLVAEFLSKNAFTEKQAGQATGAFMKAHGKEVDAGVASKLIREKLVGK